MIKICARYKPLMAMLLFLATTAIAQEPQATEHTNTKLDFTVLSHAIDSAAADGSELFDLRLEVLCGDIAAPQKAMVKVLTKDPREIYFIRELDGGVLRNVKDARAWERERMKKEKAWQAMRARQNKKRRKNKRLPEGPAHIKQEGRLLKNAGMTKEMITLDFGPFPAGDYQVYLRVVDRTGKSYYDRKNITVRADEETTGETKNTGKQPTGN